MASVTRPRSPCWWVEEPDRLPERRTSFWFIITAGLHARGFTVRSRVTDCPDLPGTPEFSEMWDFKC